MLGSFDELFFFNTRLELRGSRSPNLKIRAAEHVESSKMT